MMPSTKFICLNPECPNPVESVFTQNKMNFHKKCLAWIMTAEGPLHMPPLTSLPLKQSTGIILADGIHSIYQILELKQWPQQMNLIFDEIKLRTLNEIEKIKNQKIKEFNQLYKQASIAVLDTKKMFHSTPVSSESSTQPDSLKYLLEGISISLYQKQKVQYFYQKHLLKGIRQIGNLIQSLDQTFEQAEFKRRKQAIEKTSSYLFQKDDIQISDKIQKLANTFKAQMVKATFDVQVGSFKANCWICNTAIESEKKDVSKQKFLQQVFLHLTTLHRKQIYLNFMSKVLRYEAEEVTFQNFIRKIHSQKIDEVVIVDRENSGLLEPPLQFEDNKMWVEVVNKDNRNLPRGLYIVADSNRKDASDILITYLVYQILKSEVEKIVLITKDHFATTLQQVIGGNRLECIEPKDYVEKSNSSNGNQMMND